MHAAPDGYTLLMPVSTNAVNIALYRNLSFDFQRDIAPIAGIAKTAFVIVVPASFPAKDLKQFVDYLKANPGKVNMASGGIGTSPHMCGELFQIQTGTKMVHVPYRGNYMSDLLAGEVQVVFNPIAQALPLIRDGKLRALGVTTSYRIKVLPDVPAIREVVKGYDAIGWYGLGAPAWDFGGCDQDAQRGDDRRHRRARGEGAFRPARGRADAARSGRLSEAHRGGSREVGQSHQDAGRQAHQLSCRNL